MKKHLLIFFLFIFSVMPAFAEGEIFVIQSVKIAPYEEALNGFISAQKHEVKQVILTESPSFNIRDEIARTQPPLILAIGRDALMNVREIRDIPVIYIMVLSPDRILDNLQNFYGINMNVHPEKQMEAFISVIPELKNIGLIYNPDNNGELAEEAIKAANKNGINLIIRKTKKSSDGATAIKGMAEGINAFWMFPDVKLFTPESMELLLITSMEKEIPILTFSSKYLEMGAMMSNAVDPYDMGLQAGELAQKIMSGGMKIENRGIFARKAVITLNKKVAAKIGIKLKQDAESQLNKD